MSFKAELEALIANANSSLQDLEAILRRTQSRVGNGTLDANDGEVRDIQVQLDTIRHRILSSLRGITESYKHDQERISDLGGELKLDLENVRQCAIDYFIKREYRECERLLSFLSKLQPNDEDLEKFLDLTRRKQLELERERGIAATDSELSDPTHEQPIERIPQTKPGDAGLEPSRRDNGEAPLSQLAAPSGLEGAGSDSQLDRTPTVQSETIEPQILAEIELKTAAHINETYRTPPSPTKPRFLVWVTGAGILFASMLFWFVKDRQEGAAPLSSSGPEAQELVLPKDPSAELCREAQALFDAGNLPEAEHVCDAILSKEPQNSFALALKDHIRASLADPKAQREGVVKSGQAAQLAQTQTDALGGPSAKLQVRNELSGSDASLPQSSPTYRALDSKQETKVPIPTGQNPAIEPRSLAKQATPLTPASVAPAIPIASPVAKAPQISPDALLELNHKLQAKDFDQARLQLERLESEAPGNPELRTLSERLRVEAGKQQSLAVSWIEKAEVAWIAGRYVTPPDDNVLVYCNLSLRADPKNQRAANLKREIVQRAVAQAKDWIQRGKFDAARMSFASMDYLAAGDNSFPYPRPDLKRELDKLGFRTYPMIHDHKLGSCSGTLKFNGYAVSYIPAGGSGDGFTESLNSIVINEEGERLKIGYRDKTLRFRSEQANAVQSIYQQLMSRMTDEKSILATRDKDVRNP